MEQQELIDKVYGHAANLLIKENKSPEEVKNALVSEGLNSNDATIVVENLQTQIQEAKRSRAKKDMLYGALWCVGGIVGTAANIGFIFWGAIVFGGIQFIKGLVGYSG